MKVGIMGGTFDPIHKGHLVLAKDAYQQFHLDTVLVMPSGNPPHKKNQVIASVEQRKAMVQLAIAHDSRLQYSGIEMEREGYIYTVDTLRILTEQHPENEYYFILGADSLFSIEAWHQPEELLQLTHMIAASRGSHDDIAVLRQITYLTYRYHAQIHLLHIEPMPFSSREIRTWYKEGKEIASFVPTPVLQYIKEEGLYC